MKKRITILSLLLLLFAFPGLCEQRAKQTWHTSQYFSTASGLFLYTTEAQAVHFHDDTARIADIMASIENAVSLSVQDSDISRFNRLASGERCEVSDITAEILMIAQDVYTATNGLYDPTVFPLVDLWGFSPRFHRNTYKPTAPYDRAFENGRLPLPDPQDIEALLPLVNFSGVELFRENDHWYLRKNIPAVVIHGETVQAQMDLGGIAKGYVCDLVRNFLLTQGYDMGYFSCGDSSIAALSYPSEEGLLTLSLGKPRSGADARTSGYALIRIQNTTISTSSDSRHAFTRDGVRYCHLIDPRTGWPVCTPVGTEAQKGIASITLLGDNAAWNDAMSTALCVMSPPELLRCLEAPLPLDLIAVLYETGSDHCEVITNMLPENISVSDPAYLLCSEPAADGGSVYTGALFKGR